MAGIATDTGSERRSDGRDRDADRGDAADDQEDAGHARHAGPEACQRTGPRLVPALPPHHDHAKPGYATPLEVPQCRQPSLQLPNVDLLA
jgi:hypothetical protein